MNALCKTVLVVDDDAAIRESIRDVLEIKGYDVHLASDGAEGITTIRAMKIPPCVIILDLMMPVMNGWGFLDFQRNDPVYSKIPVVVCSAYENSAKSINLEPYLVKPVTLQALMKAVQAFCP